MALSSRDKIKLHSGVNFSLRLTSKFLSDADFAVFEPVCHPQVDILSVISVPDGDLPITILNNTGQTVTLRRGFSRMLLNVTFLLQISSARNSKCVLYMHTSFEIVFQRSVPIVLVRFRRPCHHICKICFVDPVLTLLFTRPLRLLIC